ncbi:hypothetical protein SEA_ARMAWEN_8 [Microbacterium phage ArMaWen]|uniref:RuvC-like resolvase n=1 Tax=Microbacterium phage ArMaWen TaxID=2500786 RepID=A0A3Q9RAC0_9CAUD|nr:hypothetical protein SEA_ARMAWEN_8 [Microbacterium phage ArMaWen]
MSYELRLVGVDPGIVDTAFTSITLNFDDKEIHIFSKVWTGVTRRENKVPVIDEEFVHDIMSQWLEMREAVPVSFLGIEGYRQRGMNIYQDQAMLALVNRLELELVRSEVIDNVGLKQIVPVPLLRLFHVNRFSRASNHADRVSAARVALARGIKNQDINKLLSDYVLDNTEGKEWSVASSQTL